jgi:uncharacterized protein
MDEKLIAAMADAIVNGIHPDEIVLFGSHARGAAQTGSDFDFLVVLPDSVEALWHRRHITGRLYRSLAAYPVAKDILVYIRGEVEHWRHVSGHVVATGLREGRRLYARP